MIVIYPDIVEVSINGEYHGISKNGWFIIWRSHHGWWYGGTPIFRAGNLHGSNRPARCLGASSLECGGGAWPWHWLFPFRFNESMWESPQVLEPSQKVGSLMGVPLWHVFFFRGSRGSRNAMACFWCFLSRGVLFVQLKAEHFTELRQEIRWVKVNVISVAHFTPELIGYIPCFCCFPSHVTDACIWVHCNNLTATGIPESW